jgi:hypothetical protein
MTSAEADSTMVQGWNAIQHEECDHRPLTLIFSSASSIEREKEKREKETKKKGKKPVGYEPGENWETWFCSNLDSDWTSTTMLDMSV